MSWSSDSFIQFLDVVVVPISLFVFMILWPIAQSKYRGRQFRHLAKRELEEIGPFPETRLNQQKWTDHQEKNFLHRDIISDVSENRDFILGLPPDLVYNLYQLWEARKAADAEQWLYYLEQLSSSEKLKSRKLTKAAEAWKLLLKSYDR